MNFGCLWRLKLMMRHSHQEEGRNLTDPLLSVNPGTGFNIEGTPTPLKTEIAGTWRKLKISMIFIFVVAILAVGILIYGCIKVAQAANNNIYMTQSLNNDVTSFQQSGYEQLMISGFSVVSTQNTYVLNRTVDPYQDIVEENTASVYNSSIFEGQNIPIDNDFINPSLINTTTPFSNTNTTNGTLWFTVNYYVNGTSVNEGSFVLSAPFYMIETSMSSLQQTQRDCNAQGGYYDKNTMKCLKLFVLTQVCVKVANNSDGWHLDSSSGGYGCVYPFANPGIYEQREYTTNISIYLANATVDFMVRSADDPYISLQALTSGTLCLRDVVKAEHEQGVHLVILAFVVVGVSLALGITLFFVKRKVKREFRSASRIPNHYSRPPLFRYLALSIACFGVSTGAGFPLLAHWSELLAWTYTPWCGMMLIIFFGPAGMVSLLIFWQMLMKSPQWEPRVRSVLGGAVGATLMVMCAFSVGVLMKPWRFVYSTNPNAPDQFQVFFGIIICLTFFPFATLLLVICAHVFFKETIPDSSDQTKAMISNVITRRALPNTKFTIFGLFMLFVVFLATAFLPPLWNVQTVGVYNIFHSPFSVLPANNSNIAVIKLYLDVVVFYGVVLAIVTVGILASMSRGLRRFLSYWVRVRIGSIFVDSSFGELAFIGTVIGLAVWWFWWWFWGYGRIASMPDTLERLARVLGHMTNLFASLLLFPITRNSIWVEILGIPFERAVKYHRWGGVVVFIALTGHMLVWWIKWSCNGTLLHNIFSVQNSEHPDNWSIPMVELTWLGGAIMVLLSQNWFRRRRFELFYYTHHFFIVFFITGLIHAWSLWYFCGGGMILWFVDRLIRYYKSSLSFPVTDVQVHNNGDTTQITLAPNGFTFRAGQYAFINIPSITPLEWHPFTISSAPGETQITFHIKNMGKNTWTARLARIYGGDGLSFSRVSTRPVVNIDGPYGSPPDFTSHANIFLVAGGIGITPMISILKELYQLHKQNDIKVRNLKNVYLLWVVRDLAILNMFREVFDEINSDHTARDRFHIMFRVTQRSFSAKIVETDPINPPPVMGRPNIQQEFADVAAKCGSHVLAMVCGPEPMVKEVQTGAYKYRFELHMETFEL